MYQINLLIIFPLKTITYFSSIHLVLYSIDLNLKNINWFINLNQSLDLTTNHCLMGSNYLL